MNNDLSLFQNRAAVMIHPWKIINFHIEIYYIRFGCFRLIKISYNLFFFFFFKNDKDNKDIGNHEFRNIVVHRFFNKFLSRFELIFMDFRLGNEINGSNEENLC